LTAVRRFYTDAGDKDLYAEDQAYFDLMIEELDRPTPSSASTWGWPETRLSICSSLLDEMIIALYPIIKSEANLRDMQVKIDLGQPPEVLLDQSEIRQLILNMTRNGMDAMQPGSAHHRYQLRRRRIHLIYQG
jgi:signal transduction histidine kinase